MRARLARRAEDWRWSSAAAHLAGRDDGLVSAAPLLARVGDWRAFLEDGIEAAAVEAIRGHERTGRPLGSEAFVTPAGGRSRPSPLAAETGAQAEVEARARPEIGTVSPESRLAPSAHQVSV